jgi:hypothetical protein
VKLNGQRRFFPGILVLMLFALAYPCRAGFLGGTTGELKVVPGQATAGKGVKEFSDKITFADSKFSSTYFSAKGFKPAAYPGETEPNEAEFGVEQTSESDGVVTWLGEIRGKQIVSRLIWRRNEGATLSYNFEGTKH